MSRCCEENNLCLLRESNTQFSGRPFCSQVTLYCLNCPASSTNKCGYCQKADLLDYCQTEHNGIFIVTYKLVCLDTSFPTLSSSPLKRQALYYLHSLYFGLCWHTWRHIFHSDTRTVELWLSNMLRHCSSFEVAVRRKPRRCPEACQFSTVRPLLLTLMSGSNFRSLFTSFY